MSDPIDTLAVGVAADRAAEKKARGKRGAKAEQAGAQAAQEATDAGSTADEAQDLGEVVANAVEQALDEGVVTDLAQPAPAVPDSPGDDRESVFARRLARLDKIVDEAEFESGTAFGDLRDTMLDLFKHRPAIWTAMPKSDQQDVIRAIEAAAKRMLSKVVLVIAQEDSLTVEGTMLGQFSVKGDALEVKLKVDHVDGETLLDVHKMAGHKIVLVSADDKRFMSARRTPEVQEDQRPLPFADQKPSDPPAGPEGDTDLNPDDDEADTGEAADESGEFGVFDTARKEWLANEDGGEDGWTDIAGDAGRWTFDRAKELAAVFGEGTDGEIVTRRLGDDDAADQREAG